ncbi:AraC family transcriptional regulator [Neobacillus ginsengisoli]|uniref:AraC family transcriptional regulator of arabinose operon n=1 Tax=Neobacillus ginsengisoli TaxID=904295 RepID=A0ABT9XRU7_9BACI|nr:AraC family transcriptional regulator [Neobacillus ginsengisoli]MDQ0198000.1 AraC family transcriptional regulator of arabinose operon [Neobacillus ginsengisoli]
MTTNIFFCGYSYHINGYHSQYKSGYPIYLFRLQTEGLCEVVVKKRKMELGKGDLLLIKPGDHYELLVKEGQNSGDYHLGCDGAWIDEWWSRCEKPDVSRINLDEKLLSLWRQIMIEKRRPASIKNEELAGYLLRALCLSLERAVNETDRSFSHPYPVARMMRYIEEHATIAFKVEDVAQHAGLSVSRSVHLFKSSVGKTMMEYAQEIRLSVAIERMQYTTLTLEQIAEDCGFGTYPYFHKVFKKKYGKAPGVYRRLEY